MPPKAAEAREARLGRKTCGERVVADLARRALDERELILEKHEAIRLVDQPQGQVRAAEHAGERSTCALDHVGDGTHRARLRQPIVAHRTSLVGTVTRVARDGKISPRGRLSSPLARAKWNGLRSVTHWQSIQDHVIVA